MWNKSSVQVKRYLKTDFNKGIKVQDASFKEKWCCVHMYKIPCHDCEVSYIGETKRTLEKRIQEHKYAVKVCDRNNGIAVHTWDKEHRPDWEAAEIKVMDMFQ